MTSALSSTPPDDVERALPGFFDWESRIGRAQFLLFSTLGSLPLVLAMLLSGASVETNLGLYMAGNIVSNAVGIFMACRRLGDIDRSPWLAALLLVPLLNGLVFIWLVCSAGCAHTTWRGEAPPPHGSGLTVAAAGAFILFAIAAAFAMLSAH